MSKYVALLVAVGFSASLVSAQEADLRETGAEIDSARGEMTAGLDMVDETLALLNTAPEELGFFELANPSLWFFCVFILCLLLLLLALRRGIQRASRPMQKNHMSQTSKPRESAKRQTAGPSQTGEADRASTPRAPLVKPAQVVTIKVRKLARKQST